VAPACRHAINTPSTAWFHPSYLPAQVDAWVDFASHDVELPATLWVYPILGWADFNAKVHDKVREPRCIEAAALPATA
jgi:hypothetical protein